MRLTLKATGGAILGACAPKEARPSLPEQTVAFKEELVEQGTWQAVENLTLTHDFYRGVGEEAMKALTGERRQQYWQLYSKLLAGVGDIHGHHTPSFWEPIAFKTTEVVPEAGQPLGNLITLLNTQAAHFGVFGDAGQRQNRQEELLRLHNLTVHSSKGARFERLHFEDWQTKRDIGKSVLAIKEPLSEKQIGDLREVTDEAISTWVGNCKAALGQWEQAGYITHPLKRLSMLAPRANPFR
jgi:hypothetical protein